MIEQLQEQIKVVAEWRKRAEADTEAKKISYKQWEEDHSIMLDMVAKSNQAVVDAETLLRELTLQAYAETGDKAPAVGVGIREVTKLEYDTRVAFAWATEHSMALSLDKRGFEKIAKVSPPDFVKITASALALFSPSSLHHPTVCPFTSMG